MDNYNGSRLSEEKAGVLLELARKTVAQRLGIVYEGSPDLEKTLNDPAFEARMGTFVTLTMDKQLRGCIGNLAPDHTVRQGVQENALNAAFNDPRFPALSPDEFEKVRIEISLLTVPVKLEYNNPDELLDSLTPGVDGLIIRKGMHSSTFLPQVWEQLPDKQSFLGHLCLKAGLPPDEWKKGELAVHAYRVQSFEEKD